MSKSIDFNVSVSEKHHTKKIDKPSGTAIKIAEDILTNYSFSGWTLADEKNKLKINCERIGNEKGYHKVSYESENDLISISHNAKSRNGFALGAVLCAEWIFEKKGIFTMNDFLKNIIFS
jgi:4-hydroxy-tetrahydrodipicolinate reductase